MSSHGAVHCSHLCGVPAHRYRKERVSALRNKVFVRGSPAFAHVYQDGMAP